MFLNDLGSIFLLQASHSTNSTTLTLLASFFGCALGFAFAVGSVGCSTGAVVVCSCFVCSGSCLVSSIISLATGSVASSV